MLRTICVLAAGLAIASGPPVFAQGMPMGTMNVFANELGLPANDLGRCWEIIRSEHTRVIDLPTANGKVPVVT